MTGEKEMIGMQSLGGEEVLSKGWQLLGSLMETGYLPHGNWGHLPCGNWRHQERVEGEMRKKQVLWSFRTALRYDGRSHGEDKLYTDLLSERVLSACLTRQRRYRRISSPRERAWITACSLLFGVLAQEWNPSATSALLPEGEAFLIRFFKKTHKKWKN